MNLNPTLNWRSGIILAIIGLVAGAIFWPREESPRRELNRLRREAEKLIPGEITNSVVGYHRTINTSHDLWADRYSEWKAEAEVEFINKAGGIERTNLHFRFYVQTDGERSRAHCEYVFTISGKEKAWLDEQAAKGGYK